MESVGHQSGKDQTKAQGHIGKHIVARAVFEAQVRKGHTQEDGHVQITQHLEIKQAQCDRDRKLNYVDEPSLDLMLDVGPLAVNDAAVCLVEQRVVAGFPDAQLHEDAYTIQEQPQGEQELVEKLLLADFKQAPQDNYHAPARRLQILVGGKFLGNRVVNEEVDDVRDIIKGSDSEDGVENGNLLLVQLSLQVRVRQFKSP